MIGTIFYKYIGDQPLILRLKNIEGDWYTFINLETHEPKKLNKEAACLLTVVDSKYEADKVVTSEERQNSLDKMIYLALLSLTNK